MNKKDLPKIIPLFPLSNFIIFPNTTVPLNIFEPRYIEMIDNCMKNNRIIGLIQPKKNGDLKKPDLYNTVHLFASCCCSAVVRRYCTSRFNKKCH